MDSKKSVTKFETFNGKINFVQEFTLEILIISYLAL